ncbi:MAG: 4'-phosphopantetheinyl transferase superfamily protein [Bacteroidia bacterium]|nr:4'-phosphopantetheinyl transferase superfamily protein [Bacteroidia bacterium]
MPIISIQNISSDIILGIWKITETKNDLINMLGNQLIDPSKPTNPAENVGLHWYASRILLQNLFDADKIEIHKNEANKPTLFIDNEKYFISISHSYEYVGIMFSRTHEIGLDIEKIDERINRVSRKFLNENEQLFADSKLSKTLIWSAKESVYKWYGKKEIDFKEHMQANPFIAEEKGIFNFKLSKNEFEKEIDIHYYLIDNYVITYCF